MTRPELRWREWMMRVEAVIFAASEPVTRDTIGHLRGARLIAAGPRSPTPGAPYTYVTTRAFLSQFGFDTLRDLPDREMLEDAGLLAREKLLDGEMPPPVGENDVDDGDELEAGE